MPMRDDFSGCTTDRGALVQLQIWAWLHILVVCPYLDRRVKQDPGGPFGTMWCTSFDLSQLPTHVLLTYRDQLDFMLSNQSFDAPPPPSIAGSLVPHMPISRASSSDSEEHGDEPTDDMVFDEPSTLYPDVKKDDENDDDADTDYDISSAFDDDNSANNEEDDISTPLNPLSSTAVNQWQSSQWFSNAPYDHTSFGAFLDMGSEE
ncbi:hypothetical protein M9H77_34984 [Catharanthus roseus]|uniref:Uncharacterized protein n=1 Tax=Catharanthus roseus TaxID=4058 RepID=A0ACB9ZMR0_CATRO|nr:hypothetical protein M9H77_34984 [Catharanthus roseus]